MIHNEPDFGLTPRVSGECGANVLRSRAVTTAEIGTSMSPMAPSTPPILRVSSEVVPEVPIVPIAPPVHSPEVVSEVPIAPVNTPEGMVRRRNQEQLTK